MLRTNIFYVCALLLLVAGACSTESIEPDEKLIGSDYFPLQTGDYRIYNVEEIEYIFAADNDTLNYQVKEVVADTFKNLEGNISYIIERYSRMSADETWSIDSVGSARKNGNQAIMVEGNTPVIKLVFPVKEGKSWNGNALNANEEDEYFMQDVGLAFITKDSTEYQKSLTVIQEKEDDNILFELVRTEIYAENVGLIFKENRDLTFCADEGCIGLKEIESGNKTIYTLIEYSNE